MVLVYACLCARTCVHLKTVTMPGAVSLNIHTHSASASLPGGRAGAAKPQNNRGQMRDVDYDDVSQSYYASLVWLFLLLLLLWLMCCRGFVVNSVALF